jgi:hypothetical protein
MTSEDRLTAFLEALLLYGGILAIASVPVVLVARHRGREPLARKFVITAVSLGLVCALLAWTSRVLVDQCVSAGNTGCIDYGGRGFLAMVVTGYAVVALWTAISMARD